ncbi:MAG: 4-hydroxythreonine-4-phosphate dehydrogenase PdxA [Candidatus Aminicenantes bacterium]|nr:4-hydroxythreonine-4-phosphate dehydrogenase PdxA [Candidatus Aminicenantes bacterium]
MNSLPRVGVTLGDAGGIGPEVTLKALAQPAVLPPAQYIVFGSARILERESLALGLSPAFRPRRTAAPGEAGLFHEDLGRGPEADVRGRPDRANGAASFLAFETAVSEARAGRLEAVVTGPVSKTSWSLAGVKARGHTEYLETFFPDAIMCFWSETLRVALFSHHLPLREAVERVRKDRLERFFQVLGRGLAQLVSGRAFELLVAGLNPHAGEDGLLGNEEQNEVKPAILAARAAGVPVSGPFPPDSVFRQALGRPDRVAVALYHDQGLVAFKLVAFEVGVNVTLGLPFIRTSPAHGTAFDIAGRGAADPRGMVEALRLAVRSRPA